MPRTRFPLQRPVPRRRPLVRRLGARRIAATAFAAQALVDTLHHRLDERPPERALIARLHRSREDIPSVGVVIDATVHSPRPVWVRDHGSWPSRTVPCSGINRCCCRPTCASDPRRITWCGSSWRTSTRSAPRGWRRRGDRGVRSSRQIERMCLTDVAFRVLCAQDGPDHATIARFRAEAAETFTGLFS